MKTKYIKPEVEVIDLFVDEHLLSLSGGENDEVKEDLYEDYDEEGPTL